MGLFSQIFLLPIAPVRGVVKLAEVIQRQVEQEMNNPANTRKDLEELGEKRQRGEISAEEEKQAQKAILATKITPKTVGEQLDQVAAEDTENETVEQSDRDQRRRAARKSIRRNSASARQSNVSRNQRQDRRRKV